MANTDPPQVPNSANPSIPVPHSAQPSDLDYFLDPSPALPPLPPQPPTSDMLINHEILPNSATTVPVANHSLLPETIPRGTSVMNVSGVALEPSASTPTHVLVPPPPTNVMSADLGNGATVAHVQTSQLLSPNSAMSHPTFAVTEARRRPTTVDRSSTSIVDGGVQKRGRSVLNPEEKAAKEHKRILRNRELARVSNERRKGRIKAMENELQETKATVNRLQDSIRELEKENTGLRTLLDRQ